MKSTNKYIREITRYYRRKINLIQNLRSNGDRYQSSWCVLPGDELCVNVAVEFVVDVVVADVLK